MEKIEENNQENALDISGIDMDEFTRYMT